MSLNILIMKSKFLLSLILLIQLHSFSQNYNLNPTKKVPVIDTYFDNHITDDFRWLENTESAEVKDWISEQNKLSKQYLNKVSYKTGSYESVDTYGYTEYDYPTKKGDYYFNLYYTSFKSRPSLYYRKELKGDPLYLIGPKKLSKESVVNIQSFEISKDSKFIAVKYGKNGSDWSEIKIVNMKTKKLLDDHIKGVKFSNISWLDDGFFYSTYEQLNYYGKSLNSKIYYHKIGTEQKDDKLIFAKDNSPLTDFRFFTTSDQRYLVVYELNEEKGKKNNIYYIDYHSENKNLNILFPNIDQSITILDSQGDNFIAKTNKNSESGILISFNKSKPHIWNQITPDISSSLLLNTFLFSDKIVAIYQSNQQPILIVYNYKGEILHNSKFPLGSTIGGFSGEMTDDELLFYIESYTIPKAVFKFNVQTFKQKLIKRTKVNFKYKDIVYKNVNFLSRDGVEIPMLIVHRKDIELDGSNPTILKAYGGFGVVSLPSFDPGVVGFIREKGVYAFANIRGGGDKGIQWAKDGKGDKKQNSFNDFIDAAEFLIEEKYTNNEKLAITGGSNGGLVVAVAAIQRPDLFKVVVPIVAPLDMLRFEQFTIGRFHLDEYGSVNEKQGFKNLHSYSPYHNIKDHVNYPAMLIMTSENDDRVPPFHSYKFAAKMQNREAQTNPILMKSERNAGHYGASNLFSLLKEQAGIYGFILYHLEN